MLPIRTISATILILVVAICAFMNRSKTVTLPNKMNIICTTTILADAVHIISGDRMQIHHLMGPGVDPHRYRARESDAHKIKNADLILYHGLHLEGRMAHIFEHASAHMNTAVVSTIIPTELLLESDIPGIYDPHIWHDVTLWMKVVRYISHILTTNDPEYAQFYYKNTQKYLKKLKSLDTNIRKKIATIPEKKRYLITAHDAFSYFGKQYGIEVIGLQGINTQAEVSIANVSSLAKSIAERQIPTIFVETSTPKRNIWAVQHAVAAYGWNVSLGSELFSDALGTSDGPASNYCDMIHYNATVIATALSSEG